MSRTRAACLVALGATASMLLAACGGGGGAGGPGPAPSTQNFDPGAVGGDRRDLHPAAGAGHRRRRGDRRRGLPGLQQQHRRGQQPGQHLRQPAAAALAVLRRREPGAAGRPGLHGVGHRHLDRPAGDRVEVAAGGGLVGRAAHRLQGHVPALAGRQRHREGRRRADLRLHAHRLRPGLRHRLLARRQDRDHHVQQALRRLPGPVQRWPGRPAASCCPRTSWSSAPGSRTSPRSTRRSTPPQLRAAGKFFTTGWNGFDPAVALSGGPYRIESSVRNDTTVLVRNERWWANPGGPARITITAVTDSQANVQKLLNKEVAGHRAAGGVGHRRADPRPGRRVHRLRHGRPDLRAHRLPDDQPAVPGQPGAAQGRRQPA